AWQNAFSALGSAAALQQTATDKLAACGLTRQTLARLRQPDDERIAAWEAWLAHPGHELLTREDPRWPQRLADARDAPLALWLRGTQIDLLAAPQLAIVGARNATAGGAANARDFAAALGRSGLTITSGLAAGIDAAAHTGALGTPGGTIAVLGNGIDEIYPRENAALAEEIAATGLIVSEYAPGTPAGRHRFPARNRIIASLSLGVLVVEAGVSSGSLITARLAGDYGGEIFAIPGSIHNPVARGCHRLIRDGAKLVETASDVLAELAPALRRELEQTADDAEADAGKLSSVRHNPPQGPPTPGPEYRDLLETMGFDPVEVGEIVARTALTTAEVSSMLLLLELEGHVEALPGGRYARID
ncbi:MAG: DNA-protecting protein DprA, partial [Gammaproteobacteria bacterium]|nr:DNA-protecting protein DprA [Gammaproteobacteria bacterium]